MFIDQARIFVKAGDGGHGVRSFRREKFVPFGGPDGGDGGHGGSVYLRATSRKNTLLDFQYRRNFKADRGGHGAGANRTGKSAQDLIIDVPIGTVIYQEEDGSLFADLDAEASTVLVAKGGSGGKGNARFATSVNQAPEKAEPGEPGEERWLRL